MQKVLKDVRARGSHLDGVLIETTGLADPSPIASTFFLDPFMQENYRLDSILGVCDTKHLMSQLSEVRAKSCVNEASEQVAFSDRLLLTKTDLCTEMEIQGVVEHLRHLNPFAKVLPMNLKDLDQPIPVDQLCDLPTGASCFDFSFIFQGRQQKPKVQRTATWDSRDSVAAFCQSRSVADRAQQIGQI